MFDDLRKLIELAGPPLCPIPIDFRNRLDSMGIADLDGACEIYGRRNGFYAFESALHVFPVQSCNGITGLDDWNSEDAWRVAYGDLANECVFIGEDIFGAQFCIKGGGVFLFDPETGGLTHLANDLNAWAKVVLDDWEYLTGYPLAHKWQEIHGPMPPGMRLVPKIPFILGGEYSLDNLHLMASREAMRFRAEIATQTRSLPDGTKVHLGLSD